MTMTDGEVAARLVRDAGDLALRLRQSGEFAGRALGEAGDRRANRLIVERLREWRPGDGLLSEESKDTPERLSQSRVWVIDPIDGTREYSEGRPDWAVHVALAIDGEPRLGAVGLPGLGYLYRSDRPEEIPAPSTVPRMVVSRTRPAKEAVAVAKAIGADLVPMGSAGAKAMAVVRGEAEIYLHTGGQHEWDNCAPAAVALAHGLHASRIDGSPLRYNNRDTRIPDLLICRRECAGPVLEALVELQP